MKSLSGYLQTRKLKAQLEKPPIIVRTRVEGVEIAFAVHTWLEYHNRARDSYTGEPDTVAWIKENIKDGDILWDIGANVGAYSLFAAKVAPATSVVAFEPYIPTFAHLWDNVVLNDTNDRITPLCIALSDHTGMDFLGVSDPRAGSSEHVLGKEAAALTQPSSAMKADDVINILHIKPPTLIKMDVDGYELFVLNGMKQILQNNSLRSLIIEVEKGKTEEWVSDLLAANGFQKRASTKINATVFNDVFSR